MYYNLTLFKILVPDMHIVKKKMQSCESKIAPPTIDAIWAKYSTSLLLKKSQVAGVGKFVLWSWEQFINFFATQKNILISMSF